MTVKKIIKTIKPYLRNLLISIFLVVIYIASQYFSLPQKITTFYNFTINPTSGAIQLERQYKESFNAAERARIQANLVIDTMKSNSTDKEDLEVDYDKLLQYFVERDAYFKNMIAIDNQTITIRLPNNYREFYKRRTAADINDYKAFALYSSKIAELLNATILYENFNNSFIAVGDELAAMVSQNNFTQEKVYALTQIVYGFNATYQKIVGIADTSDMYTDDMLQYIQNKKNIITLYNELDTAIVTNDAVKQQQTINALTSLLGEQTPDVLTLLTDWELEKARPLIEKQDTLHKKSWRMYKNSYMFAKVNHLQSLLDIWGLNPPGSTIEEKTI